MAASAHTTRSTEKFLKKNITTQSWWDFHRRFRRPLFIFIFINSSVLKIRFPASPHKNLATLLASCTEQCATARELSSRGGCCNFRRRQGLVITLLLVRIEGWQMSQTKRIRPVWGFKCVHDRRTIRSALAAFKDLSKTSL
jgi:hypothetical protein